MREPAASIDLVYLWVDGADPEFLRSKQALMQGELGPARAVPELVGDAMRYRHMNEIVYSIRSARRFAPWIGKIFIVASHGQRPPAAALLDPDVHVVSDTQLMPGDILPTFASPSIEPFVHLIPGLSEIFLYANDDYLFWKPTPSTHFLEAGELCLRGRCQPRALARLGALCRVGHMRIVHRTALLLHERGFGRVHMPEHSFHVFRKSTCARVWAELGDELKSAVRLRFRDDDRALFWQMLVNTFEMRLRRPKRVLSLNAAHVSFAHVEESRLVQAYIRARLLLLPYVSPYTVCFNTIPPSWHERMRRYFETHFSAPEETRALASPSA